MALIPSDCPKISMHTDYLYILTKNLTTQSAHRNYAALPIKKDDPRGALSAEIVFVCIYL